MKYKYSIKRTLAVLIVFSLVALQNLPIFAESTGEITYDPAFTVTDNTLTGYTGSDETVIIPNGITAIGKEAFMGNTTVKEITVPEGVIEIDDGAFKGCTNLSTLNLPNTLTTVGYGALDGCASLESLVLPASLKYVRLNMFAEVGSLMYNTPEPSPFGAAFRESAIKELTIQNDEFPVLLDFSTNKELSSSAFDTWYTAFGNLTTIHGHVNSKAEHLAIQVGCTFTPTETLYTDLTAKKSSLRYLGDVSGGGSVDAADALLVLQAVVGLTDSISLETGDMNGDLQLTADDALQILSITVQLAPKRAMAPKSYETYTFDNTYTRHPSTDAAAGPKSYLFIQSVEELQAFRENTFSNHISQENQPAIDHCQLLFASMDAAFFEKNVCAVILESGNIQAPKSYFLYALKEDGEGLQVLLKPKTHGIINPPTFCISLVTIPRTELNEKSLTSIQFYTGPF